MGHMLTMMKTFIKWILILTLILVDITAKEVHINTVIGSLIGVTHRIEFDGNHKHVTKFLGIPYAKPPIGELRFARPEIFEQVLSDYNATFHRPHCIQTNSTYQYMKIYKQSEDCLYLNIYIPGKHIKDTNLFPVMVYIHGGSFVDGGADVYNGDILGAFRDVIVVTINYRLNIFGFLSSGEVSSGNFGLWDMKLALQWVHKNIKSFGGNPDSVTIFGNSAGGAAVTYQAIHPGNRGLFQRVIAQSGSCFASWALQKYPSRNFKWYASSVGCDDVTYANTISCLRRKPVSSLKLAETRFTTKFVPAVDRDFLMESPYSLSLGKSEAGRSSMYFFRSLDFMNGVTSSDGAFARDYWAASIDRENTVTGSNYSTELANGVPYLFLAKKYIPELLSGHFDNVSRALKRAVIHQYTDWSNPDDPITVRNNLVQLESDVTFFVPGLYASKTHGIYKRPVKVINSHRSKILNTDLYSANYFYVFDHKPSFAPHPAWLNGATHVMELPYLFGFPKTLQWKLTEDYYANNPFNTSKEDITLSKHMMTFWTNFAMYGNPNGKGPETEQLPFWPPFDTKKQQYLDITSNLTSQSVKHHLAASRVAFWETVVPVLKSCQSTSASIRPFSALCFTLVNFCVFLSAMFYFSGYM